MIKRLIYVVFIAGLVFGLSLPLSAQAAAVEHADVQFFSAIQDLPLMPGLTELTDAAAVFDKPEGRIVESVALLEGTNAGAVRVYYETTLPQLGWERVAEGRYVREGEALTLVFENHENQGFLRVMVAPVP